MSDIVQIVLLVVIVAELFSIGLTLEKLAERLKA